MKKSKNFKVINLNKEIENTPIITNNPRGWQNWGSRNQYGTQLLNLYNTSVTHRACCDFLATCVLGSGIDWSAMKMEGTESMPNPFDTWETFLHKISLDFVVYGGFAVQIVKNRDDKTYTFYHQEFNTVRPAIENEDGEVTSAFLCADWSNTSKYRPQEIEIINYTDDVKLTLGKPYLLYYTRYSPFDKWLPNPSYSSALPAIEADAKLSTYDLSSIINNFTPSGILTLNPVSDDDERELILKNINATFSGEENANNLIVTFKKNSEDLPASFSPIASNSEAVNLFADTNERVVNRILAAHRIPSKALIGLPMDATGFSNEGTLLEAAYQLLEKTRLTQLRNEILSVINNIFAMNGIETKIVIKPLSFKLDELNVEKQDVEVKEIDDTNIDYNTKINS